MTKVLYLKWRPGDWDEVIGQDHIITTLRNAVRQDRVSHAQIFSGPRGTGKTSTAAAPGPAGLPQSVPNADRNALRPYRHRQGGSP